MDGLITSLLDAWLGIVRCRLLGLLQINPPPEEGLASQQDTLTLTRSGLGPGSLWMLFFGDTSRVCWYVWIQDGQE